MPSEYCAGVRAAKLKQRHFLNVIKYLGSFDVGEHIVERGFPDASRNAQLRCPTGDRFARFRIGTIHPVRVADRFVRTAQRRAICSSSR